MTQGESGWRVDYSYLDEVQSGSGVELASCYQCRKCSNGCPVSFAMDLRPEQLVKLILMGDRERVENSRTIWLCASCQTCLTRCPNDVDIPRLADYLKESFLAKGGQPPEPKTALLHKVFLKEIGKRGRVFEGGMMGAYYLKSGDLSFSTMMDNAKLGLAMYKKGRMSLTPKGIKAKGEIKKIFKDLGGDK